MHMNSQRSMVVIKLAYWLGIGADALWAVALFSPMVFGLLTGQPDFNPELPVRLIMAIGGSLMAGWTLLLLWAVRQPIERKAVILITAFPVVFGMTMVAMLGYIGGNTSNLWILIKNSILMILMVTSYVLACRADNLGKA